MRAFSVCQPTAIARTTLARGDGTSIPIGIENGEFANEITQDFEDGSPTLNKLRGELDNSLVEKTGQKIRSFFEKKN